MTVAELIEALRKLPQDALVMRHDRDYCGLVDAELPGDVPVEVALDFDGGLHEVVAEIVESIQTSRMIAQGGAYGWTESAEIREEALARCRRAMAVIL